MDTHICKIFGTPMGTKIAPPYANLFMSKEERPSSLLTNELSEMLYWQQFFYLSWFSLPARIFGGIYE